MSTRGQFERDHARQNLLVLDGWLILRFTWRQLCTQSAWVVAQVRATLEPLGRSYEHLP